MVDDSRPPDFCPWDSGQACKTGNGACLPPRKRLLAGLKQSGWLSSSFPYAAAWQSCIGAPCAAFMEDLKLEVDLEGAKMDCNGDDCLVESTIIQGEINALESSDSGKSKRASKRQKCLSVLPDCHSSAEKLQSADPKSCPGVKLRKKSKGNKAALSSIIISKVTHGEKETVSSHKEIADAAKATAAIAAKTAAEAKAVAADKAALAAKAAAVAKAALEAIAIPACEEIWEPQLKSTWRHAHAAKKQKRKGNALKREAQPNTRPPPTLPSVGDGVLVSPEKEKIKEDELKHVVQISTAATSPLPPPVDDEELARRLHRAINSSPRISRNLAPLECSKEDGKSPPSTESRLRSKHQRARGWGSLLAEKEAKRRKVKVSRTSSARADVKLKSMSVINETLNLLQGAGPSHHHVDGVVSRCAASHDPVDSKPLKKGTTGPLSAKHGIMPLTKYIEEDHSLPSNLDGDSSSKSNPASKMESVFSNNQTNEDWAVKGMGVDEKASVTESAVLVKEVKLSGARIVNKRQRGKSLLVACASRIQILPHRRDNNNYNKVCVIEHQLATSQNATAELTGSHLETVGCDKQIDIDENETKVNASSLGSDTQVTKEGVKKSSAIKEVQKSTCHDVSSKAILKNFPLSTHGERQARNQKILRGLPNGLSTVNQTFGGSMSLPSYMPSSTVS